MSLAQAVQESLQRHSGKVVSRDPDAELTAGQLLAGCRAAAGVIARATQAPMVGLLLPNCAAYPVALVGAVWAGKVAVPLNGMLKPQEIDFLLQDAGIDTVVVVEATRPLVAGLSAKVVAVPELLQAGGPGLETPAPVKSQHAGLVLHQC